MTKKTNTNNKANNNSNNKRLIIVPDKYESQLQCTPEMLTTDGSTILPEDFLDQ